MNYLEIIGTLVGLLYLWLEYRASIHLWVVGIVMPSIYLFVYYRAGLYADVGINIYYLAVAVYGWCTWRSASNRATATASRPITRLPRPYLLPLVLLFGVAFVGIGLLLVHATDSTVPWLDSFTTALSIIGMWMLARKYVEQWWVWVAVDVVCAGLYLYKELPFTAALYALYAVIALFGYRKWLRLMAASALPKPDATTPHSHFELDAVVLANGDYPTHSLPLGWLQGAPYVVCCDGAANEYLGRGHRPDAIVGDGDSLSRANKLRFGSLFHAVADQETNDLTKAMRFLQAQGKHRIGIVGGTGKREDHTLGNVSLLHQYHEWGMEVCMATDYGVFTPSTDARSFASHPRQQVSIFNLGAEGLQVEGLVYPLSDFGQWWQGTLNEATGSRFAIQATGSYLVFQTHL